MLFSNSLFWLFLAVVLAILSINRYFFKNIKGQCVTLLLASYLFYGMWDWRFVFLILFTTGVGFLCGRGIANSGNIKTKKLLLRISIISTLSILGAFKYFGFFANEFNLFLHFLGYRADWPTLNIILPVGISFYTFQVLTYTIDIYFNKMKSEPSFLKFATYVAFFPQLVAGPIERAKNLIPQFNKITPISKTNVIQGLYLIIVGLFLKIVIADSMSPLVDRIFGSYSEYNGGVLILGALYFSAQIYADFCGYSTIAIGVAKIMGFELMTNFKTPYFSISITEFWRNWHISLSSFFRDYVFIPLGGSLNKASTTYRNLLLTFTLSGVWHGANWTFLFWGVIHGMALILEKKILPKNLQSPIAVFFHWSATMLVVLIGWVFFRSPSIMDGFSYLQFAIIKLDFPDQFRIGVVYFIMMLCVDALWKNDTRLRNGFPLISRFIKKNILLADFVHMFIFTLMLWLIAKFKMGAAGMSPFIYFQF